MMRAARAMRAQPSPVLRTLLAATLACAAAALVQQGAPTSVARTLAQLVRIGLWIALCLCMALRRPLSSRTRCMHIGLGPHFLHIGSRVRASSCPRSKWLVQRAEPEARSLCVQGARGGVRALHSLNHRLSLRPLSTVPWHQLHIIPEVATG